MAWIQRTIFSVRCRSRSMSMMLSEKSDIHPFPERIAATGSLVNQQGNRIAIRFTTIVPL
jgi:hypothetical protein